MHALFFFFKKKGASHTVLTVLVFEQFFFSDDGSQDNGTEQITVLQNGYKRVNVCAMCVMMTNVT